MEHMDPQGKALLPEYQHCLTCGVVAPRYVEHFSDPNTHRYRSVYACTACGSWRVEHVTPCRSCLAAEAVCDEECVPCTVKFYLANPDEFDPTDSCWHDSDYWIEALNRIGLGIHESLSAPVDRSTQLDAARSVLAGLRGNSNDTSEAA